MRIMAGIYKGHTLITPKSYKTRPTSSKLREAIFDILQHASWANNIQNHRILDIFAGSGALGIEALSRKADFCLFIDHSLESAHAIRQNIHALNLFDKTRIFRRNVLNMGNLHPSIPPFDFAFIDPPYYQNYVPKTLHWLKVKNWLNPNAICIVEMAHNEELTQEKSQRKHTLNSAKKQQSGSVFKYKMINGFQLLDQRIYSSASIWFLKNLKG